MQITYAYVKDEIWFLVSFQICTITINESRKMLEYYKIILEKVSFDEKLFKREYNKAMEHLNTEERDELIEWLKNVKTKQ